MSPNKVVPLSKVPRSNSLVLKPALIKEGCRNLLYNTRILRRPIPNPNVSLAGQTVLVTGCNRGIGYEVAKDAVRRGARLIMVCRDVMAAERVKREIKSEIKHDADILIYFMDLAKFSTIHSCAEKMKREVDKIDVLVNNAGLVTVTRDETKDGLEMHMAVHYFGTVLFTFLLFDLVKRSGFGRILFVNSVAHHLPHRLLLEDINWNSTPFQYFTAYGQGKLAQMYFMKHFAPTAWINHRVRIYGIDSGASQTDVIRGMTGLLRFILESRITRPWCRSAKQAADSVIFSIIASATSVGVEEDNDHFDPNKFYCCDGKVIPSSPVLSRDGNEKDWQALWSITKKTLHLSPQYTSLLDQKPTAPQVNVVDESSGSERVFIRRSVGEEE